MEKNTLKPGALGARLSLGVSVSPASMGVRVMDQRLVWAAKQPLGNAALGALFA